mgnify:CR=1 FL=1
MDDDHYYFQDEEEELIRMANEDASLDYDDEYGDGYEDLDSDCEDY